jgi:DNA-binding transcriptional ArsR family regulator
MTQLSEEGHAISELARRLGVQPRTVRSHLRRFASDGLAVQDADGLWFLGPVEPEEVELDGIDHPAERRERYRLDRERDRKWRAARLAERERDR